MLRPKDVTYPFYIKSVAVESGSDHSVGIHPAYYEITDFDTEIADVDELAELMRILQDLAVLGSGMFGMKHALVKCDDEWNYLEKKPSGYKLFAIDWDQEQEETEATTDGQS